ncbi:hypothetical protein ACR79B_20760 [Sphingobacterium spiritivorum]|uniref:hypothetical protein n=1 Tax=Sphingobacterium spiritivorum TaxID=258 RepID=UPI003DA330A1
MTKVKLLKDHNGQKKGTTGELAEGRANYLVRMGVAEYVEESQPKAEVKKTSKKKVEPCKTC